MYEDRGASIAIVSLDRNYRGSMAVPSSIAGKPVTEIERSAFRSCYGITSVSVPGSVTRIGQQAFSNCTNLTQVILASGLKEIEPLAFEGTRISSVTLPAGLVTIGQMAFRDCLYLATIQIPSSVWSVGGSAFEGCKSLSSISVSSQNLYYSSLDGVLYNASKTRLIKCPEGKTSTLSIPSTVSTIDDMSFGRVGSITVASGNVSFSHRDGILHDKAGTTLLRCPQGKTGEIEIPSRVTRIAARAFYQCTGITSVTIPETITGLEEQVFSGCSRLARVVLPQGLTSLEDHTFAQCTALSEISLPPNVVSIGARAFFFCTALESLAIPETATSIGASAFSSCRSMSSVTLPTGLTLVADNLFANCVSLPEIQLPEGIRSIGQGAFSQCDSLETVVIPEAVTELGSHAFYHCDRLSEISVPRNVQSIGAIAFSQCPMLEEIPVHADNLHFVSDQGMLFDRARTTLLQCPAGKQGSVVLPASVTGIVQNAFSGCSALTGVYFLGNAPTMGSSGGTAFRVFFYNYRTGFTLPTWNGFASENLGDAPGSAPRISIGYPSGTFSAGANMGVRFGNVVKGRVGSTKSFVIRNIGNGGLTGLKISKSGEHAADFQIQSLASATVAPGGSTTVTVDFGPLGVGARKAALKVASNDPEEGLITIHLEGTGVAVPLPDIAVTQGKSSALKDGKSKVSFGTASVGKKGLVKTFVIRNDGTSKLKGLKISGHGKHAGDFSFTQPGSKSLAPGASTTFKITFRPMEGSTRSAAIQIKSNDPDESPFDVKLSGLGRK